LPRAVRCFLAGVACGGVADSWSRPQIRVPLRLQSREADDAAFVDADEAGQEVGERELLRLHGAAAAGEADPGRGQPPQSPADVRRRLPRLEEGERRTVHDEDDMDLVRPALASDVVLDIAEDEVDLLRVGEMVGDARVCGLVRLPRERWRPAEPTRWSLAATTIPRLRVRWFPAARFDYLFSTAARIERSGNPVNFAFFSCIDL
jgi:hypothetical protein